VPELAIHPGDPGDEAVGLDRPQDLSRLGVDLMDLPLPVLPHPERPFGPREPGVGAAAGRGDRREHAAARRIDLVDAVLGDLEQVLSVESGAGVRGDVDRVQRLATRRVEGVQPVAGRDPDVPAVVRDAAHFVDAREGAVLAEDLCGGLAHGPRLVDRERSGE
jgi:hypothetical protein